MKLLNKYTGILLVSAVLASCEKEIIVDVPEYEPKLALSSHTENGNIIYASVGKSIGILDYKYGKDLNVHNATLILQTEGEADDVLEYDAAAMIYVSHTVAEPGKKYTLTATTPGYGGATAVSEAPSVVKIDAIRRIPRAKLDIDGNEQDEIRITFKDPPAPGDFYILSFWGLSGLDTSFYSTGVNCVNTTDASVESIYNENIDQTTCLPGDAIYMRDILFNGTDKELRLFVPSGQVAPGTINGDSAYAHINLFHVTEAYFRFSKSYRFATDNLGNPFAEPANVYTNVKNGYGVFSMMSADSKEIK